MKVTRKYRFSAKDLEIIREAQKRIRIHEQKRDFSPLNYRQKEGEQKKSRKR